MADERDHAGFTEDERQRIAAAFESFLGEMGIPPGVGQGIS